MYHISSAFSAVLIVGALLAVSSVHGAGLCTGYPKTYNGKPCASTTRYWDGQMGACGCGTGNTSPFSWQWTKPTAAASTPIYGAGTWCGSGCGKCYKLTPTGVGASVVGKGATNLNPLIIKVTNLCPYGGNEEWCAVDVNSHDYDAHFDLMDNNMNGIITAQGWDNPEVTYEEVDCAASGYTDWNCQCASGGSTKPSSSTKAPAAVTTKAPASPSTKAPSASTSAPSKATTVAPSKATTAPSSSSSSTTIQISLKPGVNAWWLGFSTGATYSKVEVMDNGGAVPTWTTMTFHGDQYWGMYFINPMSAMKLPLSLRFTNSAGKSVITSKVITAWTASGEVINTNVSL